MIIDRTWRASMGAPILDLDEIIHYFRIYHIGRYTRMNILNAAMDGDWFKVAFEIKCSHEDMFQRIKYNQTVHTHLERYSCISKTYHSNHNGIYESSMSQVYEAYEEYRSEMEEES